MVATRFPDKGLTSEYGNIILSEVTESVTLEITYDDTVVLTEKYYPDSSGVVVIRDVAKVALAHMPSWPLSLTNHAVLSKVQLNIVLTENTDPAGVIDEAVVFYRADFDFNSSINEDLLLMMPLSRSTVKSTGVGQKEFISFYDFDDADVILYAVYKDDGRDVAVTIADFLEIEENGLVMTFDVSPSVVATAVGCDVNDLIYYNLYKAETAIIRYRIDERRFPKTTTFIFRNSFGAQESLTCTGHHEVDADWQREFGSIDNELMQVSRDKTEPIKVSTGYLLPSMAGVIDDLLNSEEVYVLQGTQLRKVVILDQEFSRTSRRNEPRVYEITYRYASNSPQAGNYVPLAKSGVFDSTFDNTFE